MNEQVVTRESPPIRAVVRVDRDDMALSDSATLTLSVTGPSPLRVEPGDGLLTPESFAAWHVRPVGEAQVSPSADGRETWSREYRLDPFSIGEVSVGLAAVEVTARESAEVARLEFRPLTVAVSSEVKELSLDQLRPATDIERLPPVTQEDGVGWPWVAASAAVALLLGALLWRLRRSRVTPVISAEEWAVREMRKLETGDGFTAEELADLWRGFIRRRWGVPAERLTTGEATHRLKKIDGIAEDVVSEIGGILSACDLGKFSPEPFDAGNRVILDHSKSVLSQALQTGEAPQEGENT